ncbi:MAG: hypothetical protein WCE54_19355 [Ignavibacteriaceae bacterium]
MKETFEDSIYNEIEFVRTKKGVIKATQVKITGKSKISVEEEGHNGAKVVVKKDENDTIKEIKFICSCGKTKSIVLDYSE